MGSVYSELGHHNTSASPPGCCWVLSRPCHWCGWCLSPSFCMWGKQKSSGIQGVGWDWTLRQSQGWKSCVWGPLSPKFTLKWTELHSFSAFMGQSKVSGNVTVFPSAWSCFLCWWELYTYLHMEGIKGCVVFCLFYNWHWNEIMKPQHPCGTQQQHISQWQGLWETRRRIHEWWNQRWVLTKALTSNLRLREGFPSESLSFPPQSLNQSISRGMVVVLDWTCLQQLSF